MRWMILILLLPLALAAEVEDMQTQLGAEVRFLQLEASIERNILHGEEVISKVDNLGKDASGLEAKLLDLNALLVQVQETDLTQEPAELAEEFLVLKELAVELSTSFRDEARSLLDVTVRTELKNQLKNMNESRELRQKIVQRIQQYNMQKLQGLAQRAGVRLNAGNVDEALKQMQQMSSGQLTQIKAAAGKQKQSNSEFAQQVQSKDMTMLKDQLMTQVKAMGSECTGDCLQTRLQTSKPEETGSQGECQGDCESGSQADGSGSGSKQGGYDNEQSETVIKSAGSNCVGDCDQLQDETCTDCLAAESEEHEGDLCTGDCDQDQDQTNKPDEPKGTGEGEEQSGGDKCEGDCDQDQVSKPDTGECQGQCGGQK